MDGLTFMTTQVDTSYTVNDDMKGHTSGYITLGAGMIHCRLSKQKLNTKSSTESEVVGAIDYLPLTICIELFIEAQWYKI